MNELSIFSNPEFGSVRVVMQNGEPWFVAVDVAKALGYADPSRAVVDHCRKSMKSTILVDNQYGKKTPLNQSLVPESDVYRLIMRSNLPTAEKFQTWVCEEVLPSIRKTGGYSMTNMPDFTNPAQAARAWADEYEAKQRSALILLKRMSKPPFLDRSGGSCYQKVASSTDSVSAGASYLRKPQLTRRQYHVAVKCQAF